MGGLDAADAADAVCRWSAKQQHVRADIFWRRVSGRLKSVETDDRVVREQLRKDRVDELQDSRPRPEVMHQPEPAAFIRIPYLGEKPHLGSPESINRLLGIPDEKQPPAVRDR